jgi:pimeloyl-ACP methyl ester carboxylesterase
MSGLSVQLSRWVSRALDVLQFLVVFRLGYRSQWVETSVGRMHALSCQGLGTGPPVLLIHGLSSSAQDMEPLLRRLRNHSSQVVAIDLPGHGRSFCHDRPATTEEMRTALTETASVLLDRKAVVYGNSLGGYAALMLSLDCPEVVGSLCLGSPGGAPMSEEEMADVLSVFSMRSHSDAVAFISRVIDGRSWMTPLMAQSCLGRLSRPHMKAMLGAIGDAKLLTAEVVARIEVPTVVIWGQSERLLPRSVHDFFRAHLPEHVVFEYPEGVAHVTHADRPGWVVSQLRELSRSF